MAFCGGAVLLVCWMITKFEPEQQASALESISLLATVPGTETFGDDESMCVARREARAAGPATGGVPGQRRVRRVACHRGH